MSPLVGIGAEYLEQDKGPEFSVISSGMTLSLLAVVTGLLVCVPAGATPQTAADSSSFEVASVQPAAPTAHLRSMRGGPGSSDPGRIDYRDVTPELLIVRAFRVRPKEIVGPDWIKDAGFDIAARIPPGTTEDQFRIMLQELLAQRFAMSVHRETKQFPVYVFTAATALPKLQPTQGIGYSGCRILPKSGSEKAVTLETLVECRNVTMAALAERMPFFAKVNMRFVDASHIEGTYDFDVRWTPAPQQNGPSARSVELRAKGALFDALERQVGLKVEEQKSSIEIIVVDHIKRSLWRTDLMLEGAATSSWECECEIGDSAFMATTDKGGFLPDHRCAGPTLWAALHSRASYHGLGRT
jgi:uncharacterized protein (TIGR03435 family)